ncbi:hypothetical protein HDV00_012316 [Rhizophlyctis rosea]|nr:hypothetical protein HDV00_012316 [Rhizophlyctis rosea]
MPEFHTEALRILKPGGTLAIWCYGLLTVEDDQQVEDAVQDVATVLRPYWSPRRTLVDTLYTTLPLPPTPPYTNLTTHHPHPTISIPRELTLEGLKNYLKTWSSYKAYRESDVGRGKGCPVEERFKVFGAVERTVRVKAPVGMILAKVGRAVRRV